MKYFRRLSLQLRRIKEFGGFSKQHVKTQQLVSESQHFYFLYVLNKKKKSGCNPSDFSIHLFYKRKTWCTLSVTVQLL